MGLLDSILGGGPPEQSGMSAAAKALVLVLAAKAAKDYMTAHEQAPAGPSTAPAGGLGGMLGGLLAGAGAGSTGTAGGIGSLLSSGGLGNLIGGMGGAAGLGALVNQFTQSGHGNAVGSWIANGPNQPIQPQQLAEAIGPGPLQELEQHTGLPQQSLLAQLVQELPSAINHLTPNGRLPTESELDTTLQGHPRP